MSELYHYGVKGMRWGHRKDNPDYSSEQRKRDKSIYGRGGVRRINRSMNKGSKISAARSKEADRIYRHRRVGVYAGRAGSVLGSVAGAAGGYKLATKILKKYGTGNPQTDMAMATAITAGIAGLSSTLGRTGGQSVSMLAGGYKPSKFRYR